MLVSDRNRFIFIHNPKCAGTSIYHALLPFSNYLCRFSKTQGYVKSQINYYSRVLFGERLILSNFRYHIPAVEMKNIIGAAKWDTYYSFAVVRNPYDRLLSNYKYIRKLPVHHLHSVYDEFGDFEDYVMKLPDLKWKDFQSYYLTGNGEIIVKKLLRFENLETDFRDLTRALHLPEIPLGKNNASEGSTGYLSFYNDKMIRMVNEIYDADFKIFGYSKINP